MNPSEFLASLKTRAMTSKKKTELIHFPQFAAKNTLHFFNIFIYFCLLCLYKCSLAYVHPHPLLKFEIAFELAMDLLSSNDSFIQIFAKLSTLLGPFIRIRIMASGDSKLIAPALLAAIELFR